MRTCKHCHEEALRFCVHCGYFCPEHICNHLFGATETIVLEADASGESWLSNAAVIALFTDEKLRDALARYESLCAVIRMEIARRKSGVYIFQPKVRKTSVGLTPGELKDFIKFVKEIRR